MPRLTQADIERALGGADGAAVLVQLLGDSSGAVDTAVVAQILAAVDAEANSYIALAIDVSDPSVDTAPMLLLKEQDCAVYLCWRRGSRWQACPDEVKQAYQDAINWYEKVANRKAGLGNSTPPTSSQPTQQVTMADSDPYFSASSPRQRSRGMW